MSKKICGVWFFGFSGSGKTHLSRKLSRKTKNSVIVDGDEVRKYVSFDLNHSKKDREIQIKRIFGISKIVINSGKFPIISSVYFNNQINELCKKNKIIPIKIVRKKFEKVKKFHTTYKKKKNIGGVDIFYPTKLKTSMIINDNSSEFNKSIFLLFRDRDLSFSKS